MPSYQRLIPIHTPPSPIDAGVTIGHVHMKTANLMPIYNFYVSILGFEVMAQMDSALFISAGKYHHTLAFNTWESYGSTPPPQGHTGLYHIALRYPTRASFADALQRINKASWPIEGTSDHGTHEALYLRDPDDNGIEFYWDRPEAQWPVDAEGHLAFINEPLNLADLLSSADSE